jgi:E3 ubiquitin-protein ligase SHPRH
VERALRHAKRYHVTDSPLTAIPWWRLMLDEAQNVGDGFSQAEINAPLTENKLGRDHHACLCGQLFMPGQRN